MTPKMTKALTDALACNDMGGLQYTVAGWARPGTVGEYHSFVTISALEAEGYVKGHQKRKRMSITAEGQQALIRARSTK
jgi:hypothetical protein